MGLSQHGFLIVCYTLSVFVLTAFFVYALVYSYIVRRKNVSVENFITARGQVLSWWGEGGGGRAPCSAPTGLAPRVPPAPSACLQPPAACMPLHACSIPHVIWGCPLQNLQ